MAPKMVSRQTLKLKNTDKIRILKEMVVRGDLMMSLKDLVLRYLFNKNAKNIFKIFLGNSVFKAQKNGNENFNFQYKVFVMP